MDVLIDSVRSSVQNFKGKRDFLQDQRGLYENVRQRLVEFQRTSRGDADEGDENSNGAILGEIIIASKKIYQNVGYEYFVEKDSQEVIEHVTYKISLMEDAIVQFDDKIREANETLRNIENLSELDEDVREEGSGKRLPAMEIREELDEDGNILSSSVTPTSKQKLMESTKPRQADKDMNDFERNLKGRLIAQDAGEDAYGGNSRAHIDMNNMYTFADLVQQLDEQDQLEDMEEGMGKVDDEADEAQQDEEYNEHNERNISIVPGMTAQQAFMDQIKKLREQQEEESIRCQEPKSNTVVENACSAQRPLPHDYCESVGVKPSRSILKGKSKKAKKAPKSVGFADFPEVREVESLKEENRRNTHRFSVSSFMPSVDDFADYQNNLKEDLPKEDFDSELFAQLIGAQGPDEVHERYKEQLEAVNNEEIKKTQEKKKKVSRFKRERKSDSSMASARMRDTEASSAMSDSIVERSEIDNCSTDGFADITLRSPTGDRNDEIVVNSTAKESCNLTQSRSCDEAVLDILEREPNIEATEITRKRTPRGLIRELNTRNKGELALKNNEPRNEQSLFSKNLKSLLQPRKRPVNSSEISLPSLDDASDEDTAGPATGHETLDNGDNNFFPTEIVTGSETSYKKPLVDFQALGENLDDMVKAYSLGIYDDDLEEDPGVIVERLEDFDEHNKQVELLKDDIDRFKISNSIDTSQVPAQDEDTNDVMIDIQENDIPENYPKDWADQSLPSERDGHDPSLDYDRLSESIAIDYGRLRDIIHSKSSLSNEAKSNESKQFEPIDEFGNPVKVSRFRSQRINSGR